MNDKRIFIDSNVILYLFTNDLHRKSLVTSLLTPGHTISTQVVNENVNVCIRKLGLSKQQAFEHGRNLMSIFRVANILPSTINAAFGLSSKYCFSYWDSLIVASAIESGCTILLSEDMQHGLVVEATLTIENPFARTMAER